LFSDCCDAPGALQSGQSFASPLSSLLPLTDPSATGLIGSANCSANQLLCVCGANNPIVQTDCYVGLNDAHVYLIEYCTSNTACEVCTKLALLSFMFSFIHINISQISTNFLSDLSVFQISSRIYLVSRSEADP
jgi:hypothetical protein